jgi:ankyrin repeat protein
MESKVSSVESIAFLTTYGFIVNIICYALDVVGQMESLIIVIPFTVIGACFAERIIEFVKLVIKCIYDFKISDVNKLVPYRCYQDVDAILFTPLMHAVMSNNLNSVEAILENDKEQLNKKNSRGWTALMLAVCNSKATSSDVCVKMLLNAKADINLTNDNGDTALSLAIKCIIESNKCNVISEECINMLIDAGSDINRVSRNGNTMLIDLCGLYKHVPTDHIKYIKIFLDRKANVDSQNSYGLTALMEVCQRPFYENNLKCIEMLLEAKAEVNIITKYEVSALTLTIESNKNYSYHDKPEYAKNYKKAIKSLLLAGAGITDSMKITGQVLKFYCDVLLITERELYKNKLDEFKQEIMNMKQLIKVD